MNRLTLDSQRFAELRAEARKQIGDGEPILDSRICRNVRHATITTLQHDIYGKTSDENARHGVEELTRLQDAGVVRFPTSAEDMICEARFDHADAAYAFGVAMGAEWVLIALGLPKGGGR